MRETIHERRFKRQIVMSRATLHLANRMDKTLPWPEFIAIRDARTLLYRLYMEILDRELEQPPAPEL